MLGTLKAETYLKLMHWQAEQAQAHYEQTRQLTVIIQDNATVHRSQWVHPHFSQTELEKLESLPCQSQAESGF